MVEYVTPEELLSKWWPVPADIIREDLEGYDWDELMAILGLECPDCEGRNIQIADVDEDSYDTIHVVFMEV